MVIFQPIIPLLLSKNNYIMKKCLIILSFCSFLFCHNIYSQTAAIDRVQFFKDTSILNTTLTCNMAELFRQKNKPDAELPANFSMNLTGSSVVDEPVSLQVRGHFRKDFCYVPPLWVIFKHEKSSGVKSLGALKLVSECKTSDVNQQYLLKEFLIYKIYNLITDMSFRVRLLNLNLADSTGKKKTITEYAFLMEDIKDLARRNKCTYWKDGKMDPRLTDDKQMATVAIFEYMIGNTDWGVSVNHNTRLLLSKTDSTHRPYVVPYDFDYAGFVNTDYAVPDERLDIENVQQRLYRGFPNPIEIINDVVDVFKKQKDNIYAMINNFDLLTSRSKKDLTQYLDDFFKTINDPRQVKSVFIDNARTN
jgi:hypothetical protein